MNATLIRPLDAGDLPRVVEMEEANRASPWSEGVFRDELAAENRVYLTAEEDDLVGFGGVMVVAEEAHVTNLLVIPEARRRRIGMRLMIGLIDAAIEMGARHLTLEVESGNEAARALYTRLGMAPVGVRKGYYLDGDALILWAHDIDSEDYAERLGQLR